MQYLNSFAKNFNDLTCILPASIQVSSKKFCKENKLEPGFVPMVVISSISLICAYLKGAQMIMSTLTCIFPCYKSIQAIEKKDADDEKKAWLAFWCIYAITLVWDASFGIVFSKIVPFYWFFNIMFFVYLMMPQTKGALVVYYAVFDPFIKNNREYFDEIQKIMDDKIIEAEK